MICEFNKHNVCIACGVPTKHTGSIRVCRGAESGGAGSELKRLLAGWPFYITATPDCSCNRVAAEMDSWGPDLCEQPEKMDYIIAALRENAAKRGLPFIDAAGRMLVRRAIKLARRRKA